MGLWEEDTHLWRSYRLARTEGLPHDAALRIGRADIGVDNERKTGPWPWSGRSGRSRHFNFSAPGELDSRAHWANVEMGEAVVLWANGQCDQAWDALGRGLHSVQDPFAHGSWDNRSQPLFTHWGGEGTLIGIGWSVESDANVMTMAYDLSWLATFRAKYNFMDDGRRTDNWDYRSRVTPDATAGTERATVEYIRKFLRHVRTNYPGKCGCQ